MEAIKIFILDDEPASGKIIKSLLPKITDDQLDIYISHSPLEAIKEIANVKPHLLFLDVEMPDLNGFQVLNEISDLNLTLIFTTAHEKYAIKAIKFSALDYLLKPIDRYELEASYLRFKEKFNDKWNNNNALLIENLNHNLNNQENAKLAINVKEGNFLFHLNDIVCLEAQNNYTRIFFTQHKPLLVSKTLKDYDEILKDHNFLRIHKSYLINKHLIQSLDQDGNVVLVNGIKAMVSRRNRPELTELFKKGHSV